MANLFHINKNGRGRLAPAFWLSIVGLGVVLVAGYIAITQGGLG